MKWWRMLATLVVGGGVILASSESLRAQQTLYAISGAGGSPSFLYEIDPATGQVIHTVGDTGLTHLTALAVHPQTGVMYAHRSPMLDTGELYILDPQTAAPTFVGLTHITASDFSFDSGGTLYGWMEFNDGTLGGINVDELVTIDLGTAEATIVGPSGTFSFQTGLAHDVDDNLFLKWADEIYSLDQMTGAATFQQTLSTDPENVLTFDATNTAFTIDRRLDGTFLQTIDFTTGQVTDTGNIGVPGISALAFAAVVPEPSSLAVWMILACLFTTAIVRQRRCRSLR